MEIITFFPITCRQSPFTPSTLRPSPPQVKAVLEKKLLPIPFTLQLCGALNHPKQSFQVPLSSVLHLVLSSVLSSNHPPCRWAWA